MACLVDAGRDRLHDRRIRRLRRTQALPVVHCTLVVLAVEGRRSGHRQCLPVRRVDLERAVDELHRLAAQIAVLAHRQRVGIVGEEVGFVRHQCGQPFIGCCGFGEAPHRVVAARQDDPALDIVRFLLESRGQLLDHLVHLLGVELVRRVDGRRDRRKRLRRAELPVEQSGEQRHGNRNDDGGRATGLCRRRPAPCARHDLPRAGGARARPWLPRIAPRRACRGADRRRGRQTGRDRSRRSPRRARRWTGAVRAAAARAASPRAMITSTVATAMKAVTMRSCCGRIRAGVGPRHARPR